MCTMAEVLGGGLSRWRKNRVYSIFSFVQARRPWAEDRGEEGNWKRRLKCAAAFCFRVEAEEEEASKNKEEIRQFLLADAQLLHLEI